LVAALSAHLLLPSSVVMHTLHTLLNLYPLDTERVKLVTLRPFLYPDI
jgi:hypothetical protein